MRKSLGEAILSAVGDRNETDVDVSAYSVEDDTVSLTLTYSGKSVDIVSDAEYLEDEIKAVFYYDEALFCEGERLDYVYKGSFSSVTLDGARKGENYTARGASGKAEALFYVDSVYADAVSLKPYYLSSPLPGMKLERINDFSVVLRTFAPIKFNSFGASLSLYYSTFTYPLVPFVSAAFIRESGAVWHIDAGFSSSFNFASVWPAVPFVKNLRIDGEFGLGAMYGTGFSFSSEFAVSLTWMFSRVFSLSAGIVNYGGTNYISLSAGGKL